MIQQDLDKILKLHTLWLQEDKGGKRANLRKVDLMAADLREVNLEGADLREINLEGASLEGANLQ